MAFLLYFISSPSLFYKTNWHLDPDKMVILRHQSAIFLVCCFPTKVAFLASKKKKKRKKKQRQGPCLVESVGTETYTHKTVRNHYKAIHLQQSSLLFFFLIERSFSEGSLEWTSQLRYTYYKLAIFVQGSGCNQICDSFQTFCLSQKSLKWSREGEKVDQFSKGTQGFQESEYLALVEVD